MNQSKTFLDGLELEPDVQREKHTQPHQVVFWKLLDEQRQRWLRVLADLQNPPTNDRNIEWAPAFVREYEVVKRSIWQKVRSANIEGSIVGPFQEEYKAIAEGRDSTLVWASEQIDSSNFLFEVIKRANDEKGSILTFSKEIAVVENQFLMKRECWDGDYLQYPSSKNEFVPQKRALENFKSGLNLVLGQIDSKDSNSAMLFLTKLKQFHDDYVRWALINTDCSLIPVEQKNSNSNVWMGVLPENHPLSARAVDNATVSVQPNGALIMQAIPFPATREWAGLLMLHELSHLESMFKNQKIAYDPTEDEYFNEEVRAYEIEIAAADILSRGRFLKAVKRAIEVYGLKKMEDLTPYRGTPMMMLFARNFDPYITQVPPQSEREAGERWGFYLATLALQMAEINEKDPQKLIEKKIQNMKIFCEHNRAIN